MIELEITTFFIDRCLGNKVIVEPLREAGIRVEIHDDHFSKNAQDTDWIPVIGERKWIILTKDARIGKNRLERLAVAGANVRMFVLSSQDLSGIDMADIFIRAMPEIKKFISRNMVPFIAKIHQNGKVNSWKDAADLLTELEQFLSDK
jgi:5S rRNA maturation endonuclease (ribonuclease M5)